MIGRRILLSICKLSVIMKKILQAIIIISLCFIMDNVLAQQSSPAIIKTKAYTVFADSIVQGKYTAKVLSATAMS